MVEGHLTLDYRFCAGGGRIFNEAEGVGVHRDIGHWLSKVIDGYPKSPGGPVAPTRSIQPATRSLIRI